MPTMTINFLEFSSGSPVPGLPSFTIPFTLGQRHGNATGCAQRAGAQPLGRAHVLGFWFWNVNRTLITTPNAQLYASPRGTSIDVRTEFNIY